MSAQRKKIKEKQLQGFKYFKAISGILESLHEAGCQRDKAGNRLLHMDQYMSLLLLYMFNPICTSLRAVQQASELKKVQRKLALVLRENNLPITLATHKLPAMVTNTI